MKCENWSCWKDCIELCLKVVFVAVFTYGVMSAVCCMSSCGKASSCCKTEVACTKTADAGKPCSSKK